MSAEQFARTTGSACPQYGHSKSPYSTTRDRGVGRAADVVALGVDRRDQVRSSCSASPSSARARRAGDSSAVTRKTTQVSTEASTAADERAELGLGQLAPVEGAVGDQQRRR